MSDYPGAEHDRGMIDRLSAILGVDNHTVKELQLQFGKRQAKWKRANLPLPDEDTLYGRIFAAIWHGLYGDDTPIYAHVDTMELASMRVRALDVTEKVWAVVQKDTDGDRQQLEAQVLEYEHALDHIASDYEPAHPAGAPRCQDCVQLAKSALAGINRADFLEIVTDG